MISSGMSAFVRWTCSATRADLVVRRSGGTCRARGRTRRRGGAGPVPCRGELRRRAPRGTRVIGAPRRTAARSARSPASTPHVAVAAEQPARRGRTIASAMNARASIDSNSPCSAVVEHHPAALDRARRVREVVREHLVLVELRDRDAAVVGATRGRGGGTPRRRRRPRRRRPRPRRRSTSVMAASLRRRCPATGRSEASDVGGSGRVGGVGGGRRWSWSAGVRRWRSWSSGRRRWVSSTASVRRRRASPVPSWAARSLRARARRLPPGTSLEPLVSITGLASSGTA